MKMETVLLSRQRICYLVNLVHRDQAMPVRQKEDYYTCTACGGTVSMQHKFCSHCGQRVDTGVIAL